MTTDTESMAISCTIGSPLCSLSVTEPGNPGCGTDDWNTEETQRVAVSALSLELDFCFLCITGQI